MKMEQKINKVEFSNLSFIHEEKPKAKGVIGNITIYFTKRFSWFQRKMWKLCFGLEIGNLEEE